MQYNTCKTCGASDGRCGSLINDECMNCHKTRQYGVLYIDVTLNRTDEEIMKTKSIIQSDIEDLLNELEGNIQGMVRSNYGHSNFSVNEWKSKVEKVKTDIIKKIHDTQNPK